MIKYHDEEMSICDKLRSIKKTYKRPFQILYSYSVLKFRLNENHKFTKAFNDKHGKCIIFNEISKIEIM